jgi:hypothetical protein
MSALLDPAQPLLPGGHQLPEFDPSTSPFAFYIPDGTGLPQPEYWTLAQGDDVEHLSEFAVRYPCALAITYARWPDGTDVASRYADMAADWKHGYTTSINGNPAWVVPGGPKTLDPSINVLSITIGSAEMTMFATMPVDRLVEVAATLHSSEG